MVSFAVRYRLKKPRRWQIFIICLFSKILKPKFEDFIEERGTNHFKSRRGVMVGEVLFSGEFMKHVAAQGAVIGNDIPTDDFLGLEEITRTAPDIDCPPVVEWAQVAQAETWLTTSAEQLANSVRQLDRVAGAGLMSRLYITPSGVTIPLADRPTARAKAWAQSLSAEQIGMVLDRSCEASWTLMERIESLQNLPADLQAQELHSIIRDRDDLESVRWILVLIDSAARLVENLNDLDTVARANLSAMANLLPSITEDLEADRWIAVAACDPNAWWGAS